MQRFGFDKKSKVNSQGRAGGHWLFWKTSSICLEVLLTNNQFIHCSLTNQHVSFTITSAYIQPHGELKNLFWENIATLVSGITRNWIVMGGFNDIASIDETSPKAIGRFARAQRFRDRLNDCGFHSKDSPGCAFTWIRKTNG
ncbi:hypothetical protein SLA2020_025070 [Shorea laevis]